MKASRQIAFLTYVVAAVFLGPVSALGQFDPPPLPHPLEDSPPTPTPQATKGTPARSMMVAVFPLASWGHNGGGEFGQDFLPGALIAAEGAIGTDHGHVSIGIGGWYWVAGNGKQSNQREVHITSWLQQFATKIGYIWGGGYGSSTITLTGITSLIPMHRQSLWSIQFGTGFAFLSHGVVGQNVYLEMTYYLSSKRRLSITGSYWSIAQQDFQGQSYFSSQRFSLGMGYHF